MKIKLSKVQWQAIGKKAGWTPSDPSEFSDRDVEPCYSPEDEEDILFGRDEGDPDYAYNDGYRRGTLTYGETSDNLYRADTEEGRKKFDDWLQGFNDARSGKPRRVGQNDLLDAYNKGLVIGKSQRGGARECPYGTTTDNDKKKFDEWLRGFRDGRALNPILKKKRR